MVDIGVSIFRGAAITSEQQSALMARYGDRLGWFPNSTNPTFYPYKENHQYTLDMKLSQGKSNIGICNDDILVEWHMEQIGFPNPAIGASWNNKIFTCDEESGKTYFVDATRVYEKICAADIGFLELCRFTELVGYHRPDYDQNQLPSDIEPLSPIVMHPLLNKKLIYISPAETIEFGKKLISFDGREPQMHERQRFAKICRQVSTTITSDTELRLVHKWRQGDIVFVDLLRHYHAVTGGFIAEQRYFEGIWAFRYQGDNYTRDVAQLG